MPADRPEPAGTTVDGQPTVPCTLPRDSSSCPLSALPEWEHSSVRRSAAQKAPELINVTAERPIRNGCHLGSSVVTALKSLPQETGQ